MTSPHSCAECRERLPWYVAGALPLDERAEVEGHLAGCDACRREVALWRAVGAALDGMAPEPPATVLEGMTWRAVQAGIGSDGRTAASGAGNMAGKMKERIVMDEDTGAAGQQRGSAGASRRQPFFALAAAVLIIALGVTLFGVYGLRARVGGSSTAAGGGTCAPGKIKAHLPAHTTLGDISMVSGTDGWAVGEVWNSSVAGSRPRTIMMRYQHCVWSETGQSIPSAALFGIVMNSASDGWAFGETASTVGQSFWSPDQLILLHYTGGSWQRVELNSSHGIQGGVLRMYSKNDGWLLLMYGGMYNNRPAQHPMLYHYQGSAWAQVSLPGAFSTGSGRITDLEVYGPDDVWVVGNVSNGAPASGQYTGGQWRILQTPDAGGLPPRLDGILIDSPQDAWAFGTYSHTFSYQGTGGAIDGPYILHYNGTGWTRVPVGNVGSPPADVLSWTAAISLPDGGILALGTEEVSSESSIQRTLVLRCSAVGCQPQTFPIQSVAFISAISLYAPMQGFAIGYEKASGSIRGTTTLLTYNAGVWARVPA